MARREQAETLRSATSALSTALEMDTLYEVILDSASKLVPFDQASIEIVKQGCLELVAEHGHLREQHMERKNAWNSKHWEDWRDLWNGQYRPIKR